MLWGRFARFLAEAKKPWRSTQPVPQSQGELGEEARKLLDNPVLLEALDRIERKLTDTWRNSRAGDEAEREASYRLHWAVEALKGELKVMIANAGMAARQRAGEP
jgi:hypothetical protein